MEEKIILDYRNMAEYFQQDVEYVFLDRVEIVPGEKAYGIKLASTQDWYFKIHFPGNPIMPGVLIMEAIQQAGGLIVNAMPGKKKLSLLFHSCESMRMYREVRPGDILTIEVKLESYRHGIAKYYGEAHVGENLSCAMHFTLIAPQEIPGGDQL